MLLVDSHYHYDFIQDPSVRRDFLKSNAKNNIQIVAQTILPSDFPPLMGEIQNIKDQVDLAPLPSLGFHPWWVKSFDQADRELEIFTDYLDQTRFIGEIGLDYYPKRLETASKSLQKYVFENILKIVLAKAKQTGQTYVLSIHTVRSASDILDIIEELNLTQNNLVPVFHHFNGTGDQLARIKKLGAYLSVHPRMLTTKKGRSYIQQMPVDKLLLETDLPSEPITDSNPNQGQKLAQDLSKALTQSLKDLEDLHKGDIKKTLTKSQKTLYGL